MSRDAAPPAEIFELTNGALTAKVASRGAELVSLRKDGVPYLYEGDAPQFWPRSAPILFPVVGRCRGDRLVVDGVELKMPRHGFARELEWLPTRGGSDEVELELTDADSGRRWPFAYALTAIYQLHPDRLDARYRLENLERDRDMPFSFGLHPAFRRPLDPSVPARDWRVTFPRPMRADRRLLEDGLRSG
ncbi:MAG TPA: aldose 1-epimerase family protein, partial [Planctomycetota bacterium]|nr:aldose 1-epimerase family protein [Planctomycetota bacterium]